MSILLTILKIIFIILLILLGILLLALALILFVPIHYEVDGEIKDEFQIEVWGAIRYLLSIFKLTFAYRDGELETDIYLFGFRKKKKCADEAEQPDSEVEEQAEEERLEEREETLDVSAIPESIDETRVSVEEEQAETGVVEEIDSAPRSESAEHMEESARESEKRSKKKVKRENQSKIDFALIKQELTDEHNRNVVKKVFAELKYLLRHFKFRKIKTDLEFSTGDPASTGQLLGVISMFPILYRYEFGIVPDFMSDDAYVKGTFSVAGRVRLIHLLMTVLRLIFDKEVKLVIKKFMDMINK